MNTTIKERPKIFNADEVRAIQAGRKVQFREVVKNPPANASVCRGGAALTFCNYAGMPYPEHGMVSCPYAPGDRIWVREAWMEFSRDASTEILFGGGSQIVGYLPGGIGYKADTDQCGQVPVTENGQTVRRTPKGPWRSPVHMPRWAARLWLEVTEVRVERLQEISPEDAVAEGVEGFAASQKLNGYWTTAFARQWDRHNAKRGHSWESNPWVWAVSFQRVQESA